MTKYRGKKRITNQQLIGDQGVAMARKLIGEMGFVFYETGQVEAGIDGLLELRDADGTVRGQFLAAQIKAREKGAYTAETDEGFEYLCRPEDFEYWSGSNLPVIVILARLQDSSVYWKQVERGIVEGSAANRRLILSKANDRLGPAASSAIAQLAIDRAAPGTFLPAPKVAERQDLNLLGVELPPAIYVTPTELVNRDKALDVLFDRTEAVPSAWAIREGRIASFLDLGVPPLSDIVDGGAVERYPIDDFVTDFESEEYPLLMELLYRALEDQLGDYFVYDSRDTIYYFPPRGKKIEYQVEYASAIKRARRWAVRKYAGKEKHAGYVRHRAFQPKFVYIAAKWFLAVMPTWKFTRDGTRDDPLASGRISWLRRQENNQSVRGQFFLWQSCLTDQADSYIDTKAPGALRFTKLEPLSSDRAVPDQFWIRRDETPPPTGEADADEDVDE
jgi:Domain of unknown function (DUF4365)